MTVSDQIIAVLDSLCVKFGIVIDWTQENVLPYVMEIAKKFITYEIATSSALLVAFIIIPIVLYFIAKTSYAKAKKVDIDPDYGVSWIFMFSVVLFIGFLVAGVINAICQTMDIITCLTFPEKQIFDYITDLAKSS